MKILFDHNVPDKLRRSLMNHEVKAADEMQSAELENGELLPMAERENFEALVTCHKSLAY